MKEFLEILDIVRFPADAREFFEKCYERVEADPALRALAVQAQERYWEKADHGEPLQALAEGLGIHRYSADMLLALCCARKLREIYRQRGYSGELFAATVSDLRFKLEECRTVYGINGNFVFYWYREFFDCTRFKLGRLQYEPFLLAEGYKDLVPPGGRVLKCHIPLDGPLTPESVEASLEEAYRFYGCTGPMVVYCASWILYPPHYGLYPAGSNLRAFCDRFHVYSFKATPENPNAWRVFGTLEKDPGKLPQRTSLQRAFRGYLLEGGSMGSGKGILVYRPNTP